MQVAIEISDIPDFVGSDDGFWACMRTMLVHPRIEARAATLRLLRYITVSEEIVQQFVRRRCAGAVRCVVALWRALWRGALLDRA